MKMVFKTTQSDLIKYNGTQVDVLGELEADKYDKDDVGTMYKIRFCDGLETDAFEDELF